MEELAISESKSNSLDVFCEVVSLLFLISRFCVQISEKSEVFLEKIFINLYKDERLVYVEAYSSQW